MLPEPTGDVEHVDCDLMSLESVKAAAQRVIELVDPLGGLDVLTLVQASTLLVGTHCLLHRMLALVTGRATLRMGTMW